MLQQSIHNKMYNIFEIAILNDRLMEVQLDRTNKHFYL